jgi:uncharacterized protein (TIGR02117 family)
MKVVKMSLKIIGYSLLGIICFLLVYIITSIGLSKIEVNSEVTAGSKEIEMFIQTNGVHCDIVVPVKNELKDWSKEIQFQQTKSKDSIMNYLSFGWGDKGFYLETPTWSDLKASTAFNAAFGLGESAMHVTFYKKMTEGKDCVKIKISKEEYLQLVRYIEESLERDKEGIPIFIPAVTYDKNDSFYEANRKYSLFYTCNTWTNNALKAAGQKAAFWTNYDQGIFQHYSK